MSTQEQARALMMRHHHLIKNRQQSMLGRAAAEVGLGIDSVEYWNHIQGKLDPNFRNSSTIAAMLHSAKAIDPF